MLGRKIPYLAVNHLISSLSKRNNKSSPDLRRMKLIEKNLKKENKEDFFKFLYLIFIGFAYALFNYFPYTKNPENYPPVVCSDELAIFYECRPYCQTKKKIPQNK